LKKIITIITAIILGFSAFSQEVATVFGVVKDTNNKAIEYVSIGTIGEKKPIGTTTNKNGEYSFKIPSNKNVKIQISCMGYQSKEIVLRLKKNEKKQLDVILNNSQTTLNPVDIKGDKSREEGITKINPEWAKNTAGPTKGVENIIKSTEGVSSNNELSSQYSVRGGNFDENLVYVNDIEISRPILIRNGQQEGLSFINTDMIGDIKFSSGGFDAKYGDKMSSVLDIKYKKPTEFAGNASISLLGGDAHIEGLIGKKMTYQIGYRNKTNKYLLNSLETSGDYNSTFNDLQTYITYDITPKTELAFLGNISDNKYNFVPQTRETQFGSVYESLKLKVYFDGQELDRFTSAFGALMLTYNPRKDLQLKFISSAFSTNEKETYDIQGQYWLYETGGLSSNDEFDRGIGTYLEHARNNLNAQIYNFEHKGYKYYNNGFLTWGAKYQREEINDKIKEWKMVDSSGYTIPSSIDVIGEFDGRQAPMLQNYYKSKHDISSNRLTAYLQRQFEDKASYGTYFFNIGVRGQYWDFNKEFFPSPRVSVSLKPNIKQDILLRFATGIYAQFPFYREYRDNEGNLNYDIKSQKSLHFVLSSDWNFVMMERKFKFTTAAYYKYLWDLIPYEIDNVRIRYTAQNNAKGYATGLDMKLFGEFIKGIDSWVTLSFLQTKQNIDGDGQGYLPRPTDQLVNASVSFQDYIPNMPYIRVYLNFNYGSGYPYYPPNTNGSTVFRMPHYLRADIAFTFRIKDEETSWAKKNFMKYTKKIWLNLEWLNVFDTKNVISYMYVTDYSNASYAVPNYLTPTRLNARLTVEF
jgi:hypothetical protein